MREREKKSNICLLDRNLYYKWLLATSYKKSEIIITNMAVKIAVVCLHSNNNIERNKQKNHYHIGDLYIILFCSISKGKTCKQSRVERCLHMYSYTRNISLPLTCCLRFQVENWWQSFNNNELANFECFVLSRGECIDRKENMPVAQVLPLAQAASSFSSLLSSPAAAAA